MPLTNRRVRPAPSTAYLANPHKGCCTFQRFNGDEIFPSDIWVDRGPDGFPEGNATPVDEYLPTTVAYCRWYWNQLEPEKGKYDFSIIEKAFERAKERGQTLALRLMPFGMTHEDFLPPWYTRRYPTTVTDYKVQPVAAPIYDSPEYLDLWGAINQEAGRRFDGHPLIETIDMAYIGPWGEGAGECSREQCDRFTKMYTEAFPTTQRIALIEGCQCPSGLASGAGWRCDCFGDLRYIGNELTPKHLSFNHMFDAYPREVIIAGATDTWRTAPVHLETCHVPLYWYNNNYDIDFIIEQGWKYHGTYFMPKYSRIPQPWREKMIEFCRHLGYRFILRQAVVDLKVERAGSFKFQSWIENVGVAPLYREYPFALRLRQDSRTEVIIPAEIDTRKWLPGDAWLDLSIRMPPGFRPGVADLSAGLIDPKTRQPKVKFAVKEQYPDGWVDLGGIEIV